MKMKRKESKIWITSGASLSLIVELTDPLY